MNETTSAQGAAEEPQQTDGCRGDPDVAAPALGGGGSAHGPAVKPTQVSHQELSLTASPSAGLSLPKWVRDLLRDGGEGHLEIV